jgi:hypothetical protein
MLVSWDLVEASRPKVEIHAPLLHFQCTENIKDIE